MDNIYLNKLVYESVEKSVKETFGSLLENREEQIQDLTADQIEKQHLQAPEDKKDEEDDDKIIADEAEDEVEAEIDITTKKKETPKPKIEVPKELPETLELSNIIKSLNMMRSGASLKNPDVLERFEAYWTALQPAEKIALKGFVDGLTQVIAGNMPGTQASEPSKPPYNVDMTAKPEQEPSASDKIVKKTIKKVVKTKAQEPSGTVTPIIVGEVADKKFILKKIRNYK